MPTLIVRDTDRTCLVDLRPDETLVLGRAADCDLPLAAERASRRHAEVRPGEGGHRVRDLGSTNGTRLNGAPLAGEAALADGDELDLGGCLVVYRSRP